MDSSTLRVKHDSAEPVHELTRQRNEDKNNKIETELSVSTEPES